MRVIEKDPELDLARDLLDEYLRREFTVQLNGLCSVNYQGRAKSKLDRGERLVIKKQDSALLVHGPENYQPKNWQPEVDNWNVEVDESNNELVLLAERKNPDEMVEIRFESVVLLSISQLVDKSELKVRGHEIDIHESIENNPDLVEEDFKVIERERQTPAGYIDVFGRDKEDRYVVVEVKRNPDYNTVIQLQRYVDEIEDEFSGTIRGLLIAPKISDKMLDYLDEKNLEFVEVNMEDVIASYESLNNSQKALEDFSAGYET